MSGKRTLIEAPSGGIGQWEYLTYQQAIDALLEHYKRQVAEARAVFREIARGEVRVFHMTESWSTSKRTEVTP